MGREASLVQSPGETVPVIKSRQSAGGKTQDKEAHFTSREHAGASRVLGRRRQRLEEASLQPAAGAAPVTSAGTPPAILRDYSAVHV